MRTQLLAIAFLAALLCAGCATVHRDLPFPYEQIKHGMIRMEEQILADTPQEWGWSWRTQTNEVRPGERFTLRISEIFASLRFDYTLLAATKATASNTVVTSTSKVTDGWVFLNWPKRSKAKQRLKELLAIMEQHGELPTR